MVRHISFVCGLSGLINVIKEALFAYALVYMHNNKTVVKLIKTVQKNNKIHKNYINNALTLSNINQGTTNTKYCIKTDPTSINRTKQNKINPVVPSIGEKLH